MLSREDLEQKRKQQGRMGEIVMSGVLIYEFGVRFFDLAGSRKRYAPLLHAAEVSTPAADGVAIKSGVFLPEFKTKSRHNISPGSHASRTEEGINIVAHKGYLVQQEQTKLPFVLFFLTLDPPEIRAQALPLLRDPRESTNPQWPLINWPLDCFNLICRLDRPNLAKLYEYPNRYTLPWLEERPRDDVIQRLVRGLHPHDDDFAQFQQEFFDLIEKDWQR